jgi:hypothetical protein
MVAKSERLTILSEAEQFALYGLPDFDDEQRLDYLSLSESELALASSRPSLCAKAYCAWRESATSRPSMPSSASLGTMCRRIAPSS